MKKVVKPVLFFFGVLAICGGVVSAVTPAEGFFSTKHVDAQVHAISVNADQGILVHVSETASSGDVVSVSLEFDEEKLSVESISVNSGRAVRLSAKEFEFVMPSEDVVLTVNSSAVVTEYDVHNLAADKGVVLVGLPSKSVAGASLSFKVEFALDSGYTFTDKVEVHTLVNGELGETVQVDAMAGLYSFTMPEAEVAISVGTEARLFLLSKSETNKNNINYIETSNDGTFVSSYSTSMYALYGTTVRVHLKESDTGIPVGLHVNDEYLELAEGETYVEFVMPSHAVVVRPEIRRLYRPLEVINSEHVTLTLYELVDGEYVELTEHKATPTYDIYVKAVSSDPEVYVPSAPQVGRISVWNMFNVTTVETTDEYSMYKFTMQNYDDVSITAQEVVLVYKNYGFNGMSYGANIDVDSMSKITYSHGTANLGTSYYYSNEVGDTLKFKSTTSYKVINSVEGTKDAGFVIFGSTYGLAYGKKWSYTHYGGSISNLSKTDMMVTYEIPSGTSYSDYQFKYLAVKNATSTDSNSDYILVEIWHKSSNTLIDCAVLNYDWSGDRSPMYAYLNDITFEMGDDCTTVSDSNFTSCVVKQNGVAIMNVTKSTDANNTITAVVEKL